MSKYVCPNCGGKVTFLEDVSGQARHCPHCEELVTWEREEASEPVARRASKPPPLPPSEAESDDNDGGPRAKGPRLPDAPPSMLGPYYAVAAFTVAICFAPCLGLLVLPLAVGTFVYGLYLSRHFRTYGWFAVCQFAMVIACILGAQFLVRLDTALERERREVERERRQW